MLFQIRHIETKTHIRTLSYFLKSLVPIFLLAPTLLFTQTSLDQKITREWEEEKLHFILFDLDRITDFDFQYNESILPNTRHSYSFVQTPLRQVLKVILTEDKLQYYEHTAGKLVIAPQAVLNIEHKVVEKAQPQSPEAQSASTIQIGEGISKEDDVVVLGSLLDNEFFEPIVNALIYNETTEGFTTSDADGKFVLVLTPGVYMVHITSLSHENITQHIEIINSDQWIVELQKKAYYIEEVVVTAKSQDFVVEQTISGLERLSGREIKQLTSFMGENDLLKSLLTLAGVSSSGDGATGYNVRGGAIDQNLIKQDGAAIFNPFHILGFFTSINADIINTTSLFKGHIPAYHGGRTSSVLDVAIKEADYDQWSIKGNAGLMSSKAAFELPIIKGKSSLLASARASYSEWVLKQVNVSNVKRSSVRFYDLHLKYSHKFSQNTKLTASYLQSFDRLQFTNEFGYSWANRIGLINLNHFVSDHLALSVRASRGSLKNSNFEPEGPLAFDLTSGMDYTQGQVQLLYDKEKHTTHIGAEFTQFNSDSEELVPINESQRKSETAAKENGREIAFYVNDQFDISDDFSIDAGLRYSIFNQLGPATVNEYANEFFFDPSTIVSQNEVVNNESIVLYSGIEPRISARWRAAENFSIKLSYNRLYQYIHLLSNTTSPTPVDIWQVSNTHIEPLRSDNYSIGVAHQLQKGLDYTLEFYYRRLDNTIDYRDFADLILQQNLEKSILIGEGRSFGSEFTISKNGKRFTGRLSYAFSHSQTRANKTDIETINNGEWYPTNFNQPHEVKLFMNWRVSKLDRFNINFIYNTGRPLTAPSSNYRQQSVIIPDFSERNKFRLPAYHRLDVSYTFSLNRRRGARFKNDLTLSIYNLYGRKNAFSIFFRQADGSAVNALRLAVIGSAVPSITYGFQF